MKRLGEGQSKTVSVRIPMDWWDRLKAMSDEKNPVRELVRDALRRFLKI